MNYLKHILNTLAVLLIFASCINNSSPGNDNYIGSFDPDPVLNETELPSPDEDPYIIVNVDGKIIGCQSSTPENYKIYTEAASTEENFSNIRLSPDLKYILYAKKNTITGEKDLTLINTVSNEEVLIKADIDSNESEFIDNDSIFFTDEGNIMVSDLVGNDYTLVQRDGDHCNHWAKLSSDQSKMVFKDQDPNKTEVAMSSWTLIPNDGEYEFEDILNYDGTDKNEPVDLYDSFYYCWRNNNVIFKNNPGLTNVLWEKETVETTRELSFANILVDDKDADFSRISISPSMDKLLLYGHYGLYYLNLYLTGDITGDIEAVEVYDATVFSEDYKTKFVSFGSESKVAVVGTSKWLCIYNLDTVEKTNTKIESVFDGYDTLYAIHCR